MTDQTKQGMKLITGPRKVIYCGQADLGISKLFFVFMWKYFQERRAILLNGNKSVLPSVKRAQRRS